MSGPAQRRHVLVAGAGPAGLFAAERLAQAGLRVTVIERMPTVGRKLLMAGRGGLNLTHSEPLTDFLARYSHGRDWVAPMIEDFGPQDLVAWAQGLGQPTFVGSSGRVFPRAMKASPLLRAWLVRLAGLGAEILTGRTWNGWSGSGPSALVATQGGRLETIACDAALLAFGGASWPRLGSDGRWKDILAGAGVDIEPLRPSNMALSIQWSQTLLGRALGQPVKRIAITLDGTTRRGEAVITRQGLEGGIVYAFSAAARSALEAARQPILLIDLRPDLTVEDLAARLARAPHKQSLATTLAKSAGLSPAAIDVLRDAHSGRLEREPSALARAIKAAPLQVTGTAALDRAISSAGGVTRTAVDERLMLRARPGVFIAGEMLDWDAPTGGYLLQATFATAKRASDGVIDWLSTCDREASGPNVTLACGP